ncbi:MAG: zinc-binding dehydrogenase [Candidatus Omnitrophica bacterium]|nr:zinc-binding dehydrogenase [Candidatus Omnitrophota bacterium]
MLAAILVESRKPLVLDEVQLPLSLEYGQVLVKVFYTGICGAQINEIEARKGPDKFLPHLLGHEGGGVVESCGPGVTTVKPGDHVVMHWRPGRGIQSPTPKYLWKGKPINAGWVTTFNEKAIVSENRVTVIPKDFDLKLAALYGCAITTGYGVVHNDARLKSGESLVVVGAGGAGMSVILMASLIGANPIIAVDIHDDKLKQARKFGATHVINSKKENTVEKIRQVLPQGADVAVDATGIKEIRELCYELASGMGRTVLVGVPLAGEKITIDSFPLHFGKSITGSHGGDVNPDYVIPRLISLQNTGRLSLDGMISHEFPFNRINEALDMVRRGEALRCVLQMAH